MLSNYNKWRVFQAFSDRPTRDLQIRGISRNIDLAPKSVMNYLDELVESGLVVKDEDGVFPSYRANRRNKRFKFYRMVDLLTRIFESGLLDHIEENCLPDAIVLFGSCARGEDTESSDMDIFVLSRKKQLQLNEFDQIIGRKTSLLFKEDFNKLSKELRNNITNGIVLSGYLKVF